MRTTATATDTPRRHNCMSLSWYWSTTSERYVYIALGNHLQRQHAVGNKRHCDVVSGRLPARVIVFALQNGLPRIHTPGNCVPCIF